MFSLRGEVCLTSFIKSSAYLLARYLSTKYVCLCMCSRKQHTVLNQCFHLYVYNCEKNTISSVIPFVREREHMFALFYVCLYARMFFTFVLPVCICLRKA